tara:strand:+ start:314 stop:751 length:438 start_codon:yes stop_codon:yes gene_type:complete
LVWAIAIAYLSTEIRDVFEQREVTKLTQFALFFVMANFQLSLARYYLTAKRLVLAERLRACSILMFLASALAIAEAGLDEYIIPLFIGATGAMAALKGPFFVFDYLNSVVMVALAAVSLDRSIWLMGRDLAPYQPASAPLEGPSE